MPMVRAMRMLNAIEAGTTSGVQLQALLQDPGRLGEWQQLLVMRGQTRRIAASSTAMAAVAASSTAMAAVAASSTAMAAVVASSTAIAAVAASSTAMAAVAASSTAMAAVAASSTARMAIFGSDTALAAVAGSSAALAELRASSRYSLQSTTGANSAKAIPGTTAEASYILVGISTINGQSYQITNFSTRRSGSTRPTAANPAGSTGSTAQTVTLCTPLVAPFTFTTNTTSGYTWYFGLLRCDV